MHAPVAIPSSVSAKAIFVDGPSSNSIKQALGIERFHYPALYDVLVGKVGVCRKLAHPPIMTADPCKVDRQGLSKLLKGAGFEVAFSTTARGEDDDNLLARIAPLDLPAVQEIVVVTSDQDFVPILRQKVSLGIKVYWVSTLCEHPTHHRHGLSENVLNLCKSGVFKFVDLHTYRQEISCKKKTSDLTPGRSSESDDLTLISLRLRSRDPHQHRLLASEVQRIATLIKGVSFKVE